MFPASSVYRVWAELNDLRHYRGGHHMVLHVCTVSKHTHAQGAGIAYRDASQRLYAPYTLGAGSLGDSGHGYRNDVFCVCGSVPIVSFPSYSCIGYFSP